VEHDIDVDLEMHFSMSPLFEIGVSTANVFAPERSQVIVDRDISILMEFLA